MGKRVQKLLIYIFIKVSRDVVVPPLIYIYAIIIIVPRLLPPNATHDLDYLDEVSFGGGKGDNVRLALWAVAGRTDTEKFLVFRDSAALIWIGELASLAR